MIEERLIRRPFFICVLNMSINMNMNNTPKPHLPDAHDAANLIISDHIVIRDKDTKKEIRNVSGSKRNLPSPESKNNERKS